MGSRHPFHQQEEEMMHQNSAVQLFLYSSPIAVYGDWQLSMVATSGNGTKINPYILENYTIDGMGTDKCIYMKSTTAYFIIRNCVVYNGTSGIYLENVTNGLIYNNTITSITLVGGIELWGGSCYNIISGNNVSLCKNQGIFLISSPYNEIINNYLSTNHLGVDLTGAYYNNITNNTIINSEMHNMLLDSSHNNTISNNTLSHADAGCILSNSYNNSFLGNEVLNNYWGFGIEESNANIFINNSIFNNTRGVCLDKSHFNQIIGNYLNWNTEIGVYLDESNYNIITSNNFIHNGEAILEESNCRGNLVKNNTIIDGGSIPAFIHLFNILGTIFAGAIYIRKRFMIRGLYIFKKF